MSFIQPATKKDIESSNIIKIDDRVDVVIHHTGQDGIPTGCCYIEFKYNESFVILASPCPFKL